MRARKNLLEFQRQLLERLAAAPHNTTSDTLLGVSLGDQRWLINLSEISEVVPCPPIELLPLTKPWLRGAANFRGQIYSVVDLANFIVGSATPTPTTAGSRLLLVHRRVTLGCALLVSKVLGLRNPASFADDATTPTAFPWVKATRIDGEQRRWAELDLRRLTSHQTFLDVAS